MNSESATAAAEMAGKPAAATADVAAKSAATAETPTTRATARRGALRTCESDDRGGRDRQNANTDCRHDLLLVPPA